MYFVVQKHSNLTIYNNLTKYSLMSRDMRFPTNGDILTSVDSDEPVFQVWRDGSSWVEPVLSKD